MNYAGNPWGFPAVLFFAFFTLFSWTNWKRWILGENGRSSGYGLYLYCLLSKIINRNHNSIYLRLFVRFYMTDQKKKYVLPHDSGQGHDLNRIYMYNSHFTSWRTEDCLIRYGTLQWKEKVFNLWMTVTVTPPLSLPHTIMNRIRWDMACTFANNVTGRVFLRFFL